MSSKLYPTLLLVDDDLPVLEALNELFLDHFHTILATSGAQALDVIHTNHDIRAVVLDIKMANMNGVDTYRAIKGIAPRLPIIIHTGGSGEQTTRLFESLHPFACLQKGKSIAELIKAVHAAVEQASEQSLLPDQ